jgi:hypothetical protein
LFYYRVIEDRIDELVVAQVGHVEFITSLLLQASDLIFLKLIRTLLSHLPPIEVVCLLLLQPIKFDKINKIESNHLLLLPFGAQVQHDEGVSHEVVLDLPIQGAVRAEGCQGIYLKDIWLQLSGGFLAQDDIEAKNLKAERVLEVVRLTRPVNMLKVRLHRDDCHCDDVLDLLPEVIRNDALVCLIGPDVVKHCSKASLVTCRVIILIFIEFEGITLLLDCIVSEMHEEIIDVLGVVAGRLVLLGGEASQTLLIHKDPQGIHSIDQGINPQIEF